MVLIAKVNDVIYGLSSSRNSVIVKWTDTKGKTGSTTGDVHNDHIKVLVARWHREHPDQG